MAVLLKANPEDVLKMAENILEMADPTFEKVSEKERNDILKVMRNRISEILQLNNSLADASKLSDAELAEKMKKLLSDTDYKTISGYVDQETYTMEISNTEATVLRGKKKFRDAIQLNTFSGITESRTVQVVSLVAESVFFVIGVIGFKVAVEEALMQRIIDEIMPVVRQPAFQRVVDVFIEAWSKGNAWGKAKAIFNLIKETNAHGIFWKIVKLAFQEMPWYDKIITIASIAAMIAAEFATDGVALIAKLALSVNDAYNITKKVVNLSKLRDMSAAL